MSQGSCPVDQPQSIPSITAQLQSENLCSQLNVVASLSAELGSYTDNSFTTTTLAFISNSPMFFEVTVDAAVTVQSVAVSDVFVLVSGSPTVQVVSASEGVDPSLNYNFYSPSANQAGFQFDAVLGDSGFFVFNSGNAGLITFTVQANIAVTYVTSFTSRKRSIVTETISVTKQVILNARNSATSSSFTEISDITSAATASASGMAPPFLPAVVVGGAAAMAAVVGFF